MRGILYVRGWIFRNRWVRMNGWGFMKWSGFSLAQNVTQHSNEQLNSIRGQIMF